CLHTLKRKTSLSHYGLATGKPIRAAREAKFPAFALAFTQVVLVETSLPQLAASARNGFKCKPGLLQKAGFTLLGGFLLIGAFLRFTLLRGFLLIGAFLRFTLLRGFLLIGAFLRFTLLRGFLLIGAFLRCGLRDRWPIWVRVGSIACRCTILLASALVRRKADGRRKHERGRV